MFRIALAALLSAAVLGPGVNAKEINVSGSTSVARLMDVLAEEFNNTHKDNYVAIQGIGSTAGITMVKKGISEIGMSSRYLTEGEKTEDLTLFPVAFDGLAIIVNHSNEVNNLSRQQLYDIYKGKITNWKDVGGADRQIAVVTREASSGSRYSFESLLGLTKVIGHHQVSDINQTNLVVNSNSMVKTIVNHNLHAIGFVSDGSVDASVKELTFEGIAATPENIAAKKYELARPFLLLYKEETLPKGGTEFIHFVGSERAKVLISQYGYIPADK
ncbi:phosphate ABC transporter substrate-binding protein [Vibrio sp. HA2012]|uniref:phosphate ABC transporter substrate-binding protein n=1 Tax=Vibrio sp. HA2012 TaxID=1971595 RepID=UPI000C2C8B21|nr:phosphate ABC transporter substrate-binding protein [Vibrio sp. HA2012]PJC87485.1 phosphate ABC transporter substrate-binding protein [Vibrio sp. HA2012]